MRDDAEAERLAIELRKLLHEPEARLSGEYDRTIERAITLESMSDGTLLIKVAYDPSTPLNEIEQAIQNRFMTLYLRMANWTYRLTALEPNRSLSSARMMDEVAVYAAEGKVFHFNLLYDEAIWRAHRVILHDQLKAYELSANPHEKASILDAIANGSLTGDLFQGVPLLPFAGVATAHQAVNSKAAIELKRYFRNDLEDPLGLVNASSKNEFVLRQLMLRRVVERENAQSVFEIHAHSLAHVRSYLRIGFKDAGLIRNPKFPDAQIHLLRATREEVIERITQNLNKNQ